MLRWILERLAPDAAPGAFNDWQLISTSTLSWAQLLFFGLLVVAALVASALGVWRLGARRRTVLIALRVVAGLAVLALLIMPAIELRAVSKVRSRVALLVDGSRSMSLATTEGTRAERVARHLAEASPTLSALATDAVLETYVFGERLRGVDSLPSPLPTEDTKSDLARALGDVALQSSGRDLGAVIVYSDGADTEGLTPERASELGRSLGVPIHVVGFDAASAAPDLAIRRVVGDDFAFLHNQVTLDVQLEQRGLDLPGTVVTLKRDDTVVASKEVSFDALGRAQVSFDFKPNKIGRAAYEISVPVAPGEAVATNNTRAFVLKVIRDRIRVLQVAGRPSWDERFLRELLKRNPNVDLISFFILRSTTDQQKAAQEELALIPFPVSDLFTKEIHSFDVVIYQNFTYKPYRMEGYLPSIAEYIEKGGSFLMIGGSESFEDGSYAGTPLADLLPVRLGGAAPWEMGEYRPRLTAEGRRHPITLIGESGEPPEAVYQRLPALEGVNSTLGLMPGAQALLTHPSLPGNPPVVAIREVAEGRTMAVTTDSLWFWRFLAVGEGGAGREFDRFWNNALRWLIRDPELARVRIDLDHAVHAQSEPVSGVVKVLGPDYRGVADVPVVLELWPAHSKKGPPLVRREARTLPEGSVGFDLGVQAPGSYVLRASATGGAGAAEAPVIVESSDAETQDPFPHPELLRALADGSGGSFTPISRPLGSVDIKESRRVEVDRSRVIPVWDGYPALLVLLGALGAEWWLRRRSGLL